MREMTEKCAWEVLDGSTLCLVSLTLHFLRATLSKRVNAQRFITCLSWAISENVDKKYTVDEHVRADCVGDVSCPAVFPPERICFWRFLLLLFGCIEYPVLKRRDSNTLCLKWKRLAERKMVPNTWAVAVSVLDRQAVRNRSKLQLRALSLAGCIRMPQGVGACTQWGREERSNSCFNWGNRDLANCKV